MLAMADRVVDVGLTTITPMVLSSLSKTRNLDDVYATGSPSRGKRKHPGR